MTRTDAIRTETLLADAARLRGASCPRCAHALDGRAVVEAIWLGFRDRPRCVSCVAADLGREAEEFRAAVIAALTRRDCFREAWLLLGDGAAPAAGAASDAPPANDPAAEGPPDASWDAGDLACGDLVLELRIRLKALPPGALLELRATDPGAREDIPAWCGLTGHRLAACAPPDFLIRRKDD